MIPQGQEQQQKELKYFSRQLFIYGGKKQDYLEPKAGASSAGTSCIYSLINHNKSLILSFPSIQGQIASNTYLWIPLLHALILTEYSSSPVSACGYLASDTRNQVASMSLSAAAGPPREHVLSIFTKAVQRVSPESLVSDAISANDEENTLSILGQNSDLGGKKVRLLAFGKASLLMAR
jgi:hypothetical protein